MIIRGLNDPIAGGKGWRPIRGSANVPIEVAEWVSDGAGGFKRVITPAEHGMTVSPSLTAFPKVYGDNGGLTEIFDSPPEIAADGAITLRAAAAWRGVCTVVGGVTQYIDRTARDNVTAEAQARAAADIANTPLAGNGISVTDTATGKIIAASGDIVGFAVAFDTDTHNFNGIMTDNHTALYKYLVSLDTDYKVIASAAFTYDTNTNTTYAAVAQATAKNEQFIVASTSATAPVADAYYVFNNNDIPKGITQIFELTAEQTDAINSGVTAAVVAKAESAVQTETDPTVPTWAKAATKPTYTAAEVGAVPTTRTVNGKALSANISLTAADVGAETAFNILSVNKGGTGIDFPLMQLKLLQTIPQNQYFSVPNNTLLFIYSPNPETQINIRATVNGSFTYINKVGWALGFFKYIFGYETGLTVVRIMPTGTYGYDYLINGDYQQDISKVEIMSTTQSVKIYQLVD